METTSPTLTPPMYHKHYNKQEKVNAQEDEGTEGTRVARVPRGSGGGGGGGGAATAATFVENDFRN